MKDNGALKTLIREIVEREVREAGTITPYRRPLIGYARADDPDFLRIRTDTLAREHLLPHDLLPGASSVLAFFLPFGESVVQANRHHDYTAREWVLAYVETNLLIARICEVLKEALAARGVRAANEPPTHNFDPVKLVSRWSHKSVAAIAGLGSFGLHHMLITPAGCAGRCGTVVLDAELEATPKVEEEYCLYRDDGSCLACVEGCPVGALTEAGLDRAACYQHLRQVDRFYPDLTPGDCCGKCALGPCALGPAVR
jgi:epoxyqueuosine reductase